jgi:hypothetical protein
MIVKAAIPVDKHECNTDLPTIENPVLSGIVWFLHWCRMLPHPDSMETSPKSYKGLWFYKPPGQCILKGTGWKENYWEYRGSLSVASGQKRQGFKFHFLAQVSETDGTSSPYLQETWSYLSSSGSLTSERCQVCENSCTLLDHLIVLKATLFDQYYHHKSSCDERT